jgi:hypothetical protein
MCSSTKQNASTRRWSQHESSGPRRRGKRGEMRAALYDRPRPAREVLRVADFENHIVGKVVIDLTASEDSIEN